ncbi:2-polyprenyl-6-hydroxyphenyl methylase/3-demethylubiquinone-9 3-methyltransferase [Archangium gephyra]|uniref:2-polyprenyl-6-hydroxyphenyl methylase/3-demethylubiquinone-9 3-methyltransferase n=1 Tax=Archangium gephyra TaxID=48 RepID=A0ABX9K7K0_9BACT|nr:class I SAM-dependent methyltransferase [Archangium gephyra]REG34686.1 2-polyprenyl-6-hydroxyphenyl methylase/3-demethylubiquinone-9 3-methyltransferase [Archangium gephyra]
MNAPLAPALALFSHLPLSERFHVHARAFSAPLEAVASRVPAGGTVADVGCGHGLLSALLALGDSRRIVHGVDPDPRKIEWARSGPGRLPNVRAEVGTVESLAERLSGQFDAVVVSDVLYLLPVERWPGFLREARRLLRPGGRLLLKEAEGDRSWKHYKCLAQEVVMVKLLGRTKAGGALVLQPREAMEALLRQAGFTPRETVALGTGYSTPHILYVAEATAGDGAAASAP